MRVPLVIVAIFVSGCIDTQRRSMPLTSADATTATGTNPPGDTGQTPDTTPACQSGTDSPRCSTDRLGVQDCVNNTWATTACSPNEACVDIQGPYCIPAFGTATCYEQLRCATVCPDDAGVPREECAFKCYASAAPTEQPALKSASECFTHLCGGACAAAGAAAGTPECYAALFECVATQCTDELASCDFGSSTGSHTCGEIRNCTKDCDSGTAKDMALCTIDCGRRGDEDAQRAYALVDLCEFFVCPTGGAGCLIATTAYCGGYLRDCQNDQ